METLTPLILPFLLLLSRVTAFVMTMPVFGWTAAPMVIRAGLAMVLTLFWTMVLPLPAAPPEATHVLAAALLLIREILYGAAMGLAMNLIFLAVQQGASVISLQMGLSDSGLIDPSMGEEIESFDLLLQMIFMLFFLAAGGHHLLLGIMAKSFHTLPLMSLPDLGNLAQGLVEAGAAMLIFALKLAAPTIAAFLILTVVLAALSRALPEMNIFFLSFPLRVGLGLFMAMALIPSFAIFTADIQGWMSRILGE